MDKMIAEVLDTRFTRISSNDILIKFFFFFYETCPDGFFFFPTVSQNTHEKI